MKFDLSNCDHYLIMSAIRGPDAPDPSSSSSWSAKALFTAPIRFITGVGTAVPCMCHDVKTARSEWNGLTPEQRGWLNDYMTRNRHFKNHIEGAIRSLENLTHHESDPYNPDRLTIEQSVMVAELRLLYIDVMSYIPPTQEV